MHAGGATRELIVWDLPTRLFHWLIVLLVITAYITWRLDRMDWHIWAGYATLTLVLFRLLWGAIGSDTARFARFVAGPRAVGHHLSQFFGRGPDIQLGHNPAGAVMVLLLLGLLLAETLTGVYTNNEVSNEGRWSEVVPAPISNAIDQLHGIVWELLLAAVLLHLTAIVLYALVKGHNLLAPMLGGRKSLPLEVRQPAVAPGWRALLALGVSVLIATLLVNAL